jgi:hypothetical protein
MPSRRPPDEFVTFAAGTQAINPPQEEEKPYREPEAFWMG